MKEENLFLVSETMAKKSFMQGALILFLAGMFVKIIGFLFQVLIIRIIGTEAVGIFNMIFPLYITVLVLSTAGLPLAISKMVANQVAKNNYQSALRIFKIALYLLIMLSILFTLLLILVTPLILKYFYNDPRVKWCFYAMFPGIIIVSICSAFRGFFQGLQEMFPPAVTQCIEQLIRISIGLYLIIKLQYYGIKIIAVGLSVSMILGEFVGLIIIYTLYRLKRQEIKTNYMINNLNPVLSLKQIIYELFAFGLPTTLTRLIASLVLTLEASLIPATLLKAGFTMNQAAGIYGQFSGVALTVLTIPTVLTFSLATSLVPAISEAEAQGKSTSLKFRSTEALRLTYIFGLPVTVALILKASGISTLLFNLPEAGITIRYLAFGAIFLYLAQTSNGILQGLGLVKTIFFNTIAGAIIKITGIIYLVSIPELNINGAAITFVFSFMVVCILNLHAIYTTTGFSLTTIQIILPLIASIIMGLIIIWLTKLLSPTFSTNQITIISLIISGIVYLVLITLGGQLDIKHIIKKK